MSTPENKRKGVTPEVVRPSTARRAALLVVSILVCFVLLNMVARWYLDNHGTNLGYRMVHSKYELLGDLDEKVDWLVLGDSSGAHGIVPEAMAEVLGGKVVNLAILANLLVANDAWMLDEYIERNGPPKNVVMVHAHDVWHRGYNSALIGQIPRAWGIWRRREPTFELTLDQERKVFLSRYVPLYAEAKTLREHVKKWGPPKELDFKISDSGWIPAKPHSPSAFARDLARTRSFLARNRFKMSKINERALRRIGELSTKHGFNVYLVHGPMYEPVARSSGYTRYVEATEKRVRGMAKAWPNFHVLSDVLTYEAEQLEIYADHVIPEVAPEYSRELARRIKGYRREHGQEAVVREPPKPLPWPPEVAARFAEGKKEATLFFGGDASVARGIDASMRADGDPVKFFERVRPWVSSADLAFVNLECVLSESDAEPANKRWRILAPPANVKGLTGIGLDVVSVANNHTLDHGRQGFTRTLEVLAEEGLLATGMLYERGEQQRPLVVEVAGAKVGFLAYSDIGKWRAKPGSPEDWYPKFHNYDARRIRKDIARLKSHVDLVVLSLHWGWEYSMTETDNQRRDAHSFVDAGADLIIGHHPHVSRVVEEYKDGLIAYSLGDFSFDKSTPFKAYRNRRRFFLTVKIEGGKRTGYELLPVNADDGHRPHPDDSVDTESWRYVEPTTPYDFARHVPDARVVRTFDGAPQACSTWSLQQPKKRNNGYLQWLKPRWVCPEDQQRPWLTVALTGNRSAAVFEKGVWAHPDPRGVLSITFPEVPMGKSLDGFGGMPDWPLTLAGAAPPEVQLEVRVDGRAVHTQAFPYTAGWKPMTIDTSALAGRVKDVEVRVSGGPPQETGFVFNLEVR